MMRCSGSMFAAVAMNAILMAEATSAEQPGGATTAAPQSPPAKKPSGFAALLSAMTKKSTGVIPTGAKGKDVIAAAEATLLAEIPELLGGLWDVIENEDGTVTRIPKIAENTGRPSVIWTSRLPINKGNVYVSRCGVLITPAIARYIIDHFGRHNRNQTKPAIKRYQTDMEDGNWPYVGNTFGFVVAKSGEKVVLGQCNGGHTCKAVIESGVSVEVDIYFGIPERHANKADVNIARTGKDVIGRLHRYDSYNGLSEIDGQPIGITLTADDCKAMSDIHSQAIRIIACIMSYKPVKDSEPLGPGAIADLDSQYGDPLEGCVLDTYLLDKAALWTNDKGNKVAGGLKRLMSLSHASALMAIASISGDVVRDEKTGVVKKVANLEIDDEMQLMCSTFFRDLVAYDDETSEENPAVALRITLQRFKNNSVTNQNIRWLAEKYALFCAFLIHLKAEGADGSESVQVPDYDTETLASLGVKGTNLASYLVHFNSALDQAAPAKEETAPTSTSGATETASGVAEIDDDEEMPASTN